MNGITFVNGKAKAERLRFTVEDDLSLLREVVSQNPYEQNGKWEIVQNHLSNHTGKAFSLRTIKEHVEHLLKLWMKNDKANLKKTGTEQQYLEKEMLLLEITELQRKFKGMILDKSKIRERYVVEELFGEVFLNKPTNFSNDAEDFDDEKALITTNSDEISSSIIIKAEPSPLSPVSESVSPPAQIDNFRTITISANTNGKKRKRDDEETESLGCIKEPEISENELRLKQMELEQKKLELAEHKLAFEQEKFEFEKEMRREKLKMEMSERQSFIRLMERQQDLIDAFLKQNIKLNDNNN